MSKIQLLITLTAKNGLLRSRDLAAQGIPRSYLQRFCQQGLLKRVGWGLYAPVHAETTEYLSLQQVAKRVPHGVIALLSALEFHHLTTELPREIWIAIGPQAQIPRFQYPPLRVVRFSGVALTHGVEEHKIDGVVLRVTSKAKTVADCFKYRHKIGLDVALEAMRDYVRGRGSMDALWAAATACRVNNVMQPYLEAMV